MLDIPPLAIEPASLYRQGDRGMKISRLEFCPLPLALFGAHRERASGPMGSASQKSKVKTQKSKVKTPRTLCSIIAASPRF
jgi:hypothetical protein